MEKVKKFSKSSSELKNLEMLKWTIQDLLLKYDEKLSSTKNFLLSS
jgi:hypothetical protein